jgi:hypothetical protein
VRVDLPCKICGRQSAHVEVVAPGEYPEEFDTWPEPVRGRWPQDKWWLVFNGPAAGSGYGNTITEERATRITRAFRQPLTHTAIREADFHDDAGYCGRCEALYCPGHWNVTGSGAGRCPEGHGKSLDPHWSPEW